PDHPGAAAASEGDARREGGGPPRAIDRCAQERVQPGAGAERPSVERRGRAVRAIRARRGAAVERGARDARSSRTGDRGAAQAARGESGGAETLTEVSQAFRPAPDDVALQACLTCTRSRLAASDS